MTEIDEVSAAIGGLRDQADRAEQSRMEMLASIETIERNFGKLAEANAKHEAMLTTIMDEIKELRKLSAIVAESLGAQKAFWRIMVFLAAAASAAGAWFAHGSLPSK